MEWGINDPLKGRAYGMKRENDQERSLEKTQNYEQKGGQYYPTDRSGKVDEWGAMVKHMTARNEIIQKEKHEEKKNQQQEYQRFLDMQRLEKLQQKLQNQTLKKHEYDNIVQKNEVLKQLHDQKSQDDRTYKEYINGQYIRNIEAQE